MLTTSIFFGYFTDQHHDVTIEVLIKGPLTKATNLTISKAKKKSIGALWAITASKVLFQAHWRPINISPIRISDYTTIVSFFILSLLFSKILTTSKIFVKFLIYEILFNRALLMHLNAHYLWLTSLYFYVVSYLFRPTSIFNDLSQPFWTFNVLIWLI